MANRVVTTPAGFATAIATAKPSVDPQPPKKKGRVPLTPDQKDARKEFLANEPKEAKFRRLVNHRMPRALKLVASIGILSNRSVYEYTPEQAEKIIKALTDAVTAVSNKFKGNKDNGEMFAL